jgi:hypothetical protein
MAEAAANGLNVIAMKAALSIVLVFAGLATIFLLQPGGCRRKPASNLATVRMKIGSDMFTLEVADTDPKRQYGLMHRDSMPSSHGMIFVFPDEEPLGFWMKNTRLPLDIIYIDAGGKVVSIHRMEPYTLRSTRSDGPAKYAIELNAGRAAKAGVKPGDSLQIPAGVEAR